ncbi:hypothetical protein [Aneurinibacillus tyrosinisolvens]|uniref:hypothetical protein n=1 Tax=Aneurinibacillus tyrosinisolvens TaxID=1443435 RepID=UPI00063F1546|nr:hypothetical protein [Aneurinibacillus tyrosinisolvens]
MQPWKVVASTALAMSLFVTGCSEASKPAQKTETTQNQAAQTSTPAPAASETKEISSADFVNAAKELVGEIEKGVDGGKVDWEKVQKIHDDKIKERVQAMDAESKSQVNEQLTAAMAAGKEGSLTVKTAAELYEKLMQKVAFLSVRHDFKEANDNFAKKEDAKKEVAEAKEFYDGLLKGMVEKRDTAYQTQLISTIDGGFSEMNNAIDKGDNLGYNLAKQMADKSLMKAFYLASGAEKGYGYKIEKFVKEGSKEDIKAAQAEGWAFFQSLQGYLEEQDKADADFINSQFDLSNDPKNIKGDKINQAYVRAIASVAKDEYGQSFKNWGKDKAVITSLEGALFLDMIKTDLNKALGGEAKAKALLDNAQQELEAVKAGNKDKATEIHKKIDADLDKLMKYGK